MKGIFKNKNTADLMIRSGHSLPRIETYMMMRRNGIPAYKALDVIRMPHLGDVFSRANNLVFWGFK